MRTFSVRPVDEAPTIGAGGRKESLRVDLTMWPTAVLYATLAVITAGFGVGMLVWQTGATREALRTRRGILFGGVLLILLGGAVLITQIFAIVNNSYGTVA